MRNKYYNKYILEAVTQGKVSGEPARSLDPFHLAKTTFLIIFLTTNISYSQQLDTSFYDGITYITNNINEITENCELGFCKKKIVETNNNVFWIVLPECSKGRAELSKQKLK